MCLLNENLFGLKVVKSEIIPPGTVNITLPAGLYMLVCASSTAAGKSGIYLMFSNGTNILGYNAVSEADTYLTITRNNSVLTITGTGYFYYVVMKLA